MTSKEYRTFASELSKMSTYDVRQNIDTSFQTDAAKRAMAVTELERRRQVRAPVSITKPKSGRIAILMAVLIAAAVASYWKFY